MSSFLSFAHPRRSVFTALFLGVACMLLVTGCTLPWRHSTPRSSLGAKPTGQQVLNAMQKNFRSVTAFHLTMKTTNLGDAPTSQIVIRDADGDVVMPDKIRAQASVLLSGQAVTVNLISVGTNQFITDPITGQWRVVKGMFDPRALTNPDTGLLSLLGKLQQVSAPVADTVNGTACWRVNGQLPARDLAFFTGGGAPTGAMLSTSICAGKADGLPYEVSVVGQAAQGDSTQANRMFVFSKYNESISIVAPQV